MFPFSPLILVGIVLALAFAGVRILQEYERGVVFRFGRYVGVRDAGIRWIIPGVDRMVKISLREIVMDVPVQEVITRDNVSVKVNAVLYFRVLHPEKAVIQVENYLYGTSQLAQTTLRSVCGQAELDDLLAERDASTSSSRRSSTCRPSRGASRCARSRSSRSTCPTEMQRAMAKQAEAEREKRSKIIHAEGEAQAAVRLADAAHIRAGDGLGGSSFATCRRSRTSRPSTTRRSSSRCPSTCFSPSWTSLSVELPARARTGVSPDRWRGTNSAPKKRSSAARSARWPVSRF